ncbi:MAG TPA: thioredoxin domain-containing protein [Chloroflexota bacterium]|nr:thioredoxin domain-containing protein [Chloroflexota bacterium]
MAALHDTTDATFEHDVVGAAGTVVVDFWAPWCGPCVALTPHLERMASKLPPDVRIVKLDVDSESAVASRLRVRGLPVLIAFRAGAEIARIHGVKSPGEVERWLRSLADGRSHEIDAPARPQ